MKIKNKQKRQSEFVKLLQKKSHEKSILRKKRRALEKEHSELKKERVRVNVPRVIDTLGYANASTPKIGTMNADKSTTVERDTIDSDSDTPKDIANDKSTSMDTLEKGSNDIQPKVMMTTSPRPFKKVYDILNELVQVFPCAVFYKRQTYTLSELLQKCKLENYTALVILHHDRKEINSLLVYDLSGYEYRFTFDGFIPISKLSGHGKSIHCHPELLFTNFDKTEYGFMVKGMLESMFVKVNGKETNREVVTFHNQRSFLFFRRHRYVFDLAGSDGSSSANGTGGTTAKSGTGGEHKVRIQELGPRFRLKLEYIRNGSDPVFISKVKRGAGGYSGGLKAQGKLKRTEFEV